MSIRLVLCLTVAAVILICVKGNEEYAPSPKGVRVIRTVEDDQPGNLNDTDNPKLFLGSLTNHFLMPLSSLSRLCGNFINGGSVGSSSNVHDSVESDSSSSSSSVDDCEGFSVYEPADTKPANNLGSLIHQLNNHGIKIPHQYPSNNGHYIGGNGIGGYHGNSGGSYMGNNGGNHGGYGYGTNNGNYGSNNNNYNGNYGNNGGNYGGHGYGTNNGNRNSNNNNYNNDDVSSDESGSGYNGNNADGYGGKPSGSHTSVDVNVHVLTSFFQDPETRNIFADYDETRLNDEDEAKKFLSSQNFNQRPPKCLHRGLNALRLLEAVKLTDEGRFLGFSPLSHCRPYMNVLRESDMQKPY